MSDGITRAALLEDEWRGNIIIRWIVLDIVPIRQSIQAIRISPSHIEDARILEAEQGSINGCCRTRLVPALLRVTTSSDGKR